MNDQEKIDFMLKSMTDNTILLCSQSGMEQSKIDEYIGQNQASMSYILSLVYEDMKNNGLFSYSDEETTGDDQGGQDTCPCGDINCHTSFA
jgi:hypothetical protein